MDGLDGVIAKGMELASSPAGLFGLAVAGLVVLFIVRKILSVVFLLVALASGGWAAARFLDIPVPMLLPGDAKPAEAAPPERSLKDKALEAVLGKALEGLAGIESAGPSAGLEGSAQTARIVYNAPEKMALDTPGDLRLVVDISNSPDLAKLLEGLAGETREGEAAVTPEVSASVFGTGFDVAGLKPERQRLSKESPNSWQWQITPREEGVRTLVVELYAHPDGQGATSIRQFRDEITVTVSPFSKLIKTAQTVHPVIGAAAAGVSLLLAFASIAMGRRKK